MGVFLDAQEQINSEFVVRFWPKFEVVLDIINVLVIYKLKWIRSTENEKKCNHRFFKSSKAAYSEVHSQIWPNFELIQALIHVCVIVTYRYGEGPIIKSCAKVAMSVF